MRRIRVYVDTSVFGGTQDEEFRDVSEHFFEHVNMGRYVVLVSEVTLDEEYVRQGLQVAQDQFARGEHSVWDIEATIAEAKRRHAERRNG